MVNLSVSVKDDAISTTKVLFHFMDGVINGLDAFTGPAKTTPDPDELRLALVMS